MPQGGTGTMDESVSPGGLAGAGAPNGYYVVHKPGNGQVIAEDPEGNVVSGGVGVAGTDDGNILQAAIDAVFAAGGGAVVPAGSFTLSQNQGSDGDAPGLIWKPGVSLRGLGWGRSKITAGKNFSRMIRNSEWVVGQTDLHIADIWWDTGGFGTGDIMDFARVTRGVVERCKFTSSGAAGADGIDTDLCNDFLVRDCFFADLGGSAVHFSDGFSLTGGPSQLGSNRCMAVNCFSTNTGRADNRAAYTFNLTAGGTPGNDNGFFNCVSWKDAAGFSTPQDNVGGIIQGCVSIDPTDVTAGVGNFSIGANNVGTKIVACRSKGGVRGLVIGSGATRSQVQGFEATGHSGVGIYIDGKKSTLAGIQINGGTDGIRVNSTNGDGTVINGAVIQGTSSVGLFLAGHDHRAFGVEVFSPGGDGASVSGNGTELHGFYCESATGNGVEFTSGSVRGKMIGGKVKGATSHAILALGAGTRIIGATAMNAGANTNGVQVNADACVVAECYAGDDQGTPTQKYGINVAGGTGTILRDNTFGVNVTASINDAGTRTIINGTGEEAGSGAPTASEWPEGVTVRRTTDSSIWTKINGTFRQVG